jgi:hypothetical protein
VTRNLAEPERSDDTYMGEEVHAEIEVEAVPDASGKDVYHIRFGLYVLLFLSCRAEVTAPREDVTAPGADVTTRAEGMEDHASVLKWLD